MSLIAVSTTDPSSSSSRAFFYSIDDKSPTTAATTALSTAVISAPISFIEASILLGYSTLSPCCVSLKEGIAILL